MSDMKILEGSTDKLGATYDGKGVNFALFSENATKVELCIFDENDNETRIEMPNRSEDGIWSGYLLGAKPGIRYGYRVDGPYEPEKGMRFNPNKLLIDPYARQLDREFEWSDDFICGDAKDPSVRNNADTGKIAPKAIVQDPAVLASVGTVEKPNIPWNQTVVYETHAKGFTMKHPDVDEKDRGRFAGLMNEKVMQYIDEQGISSVELLPVQAFATDKGVADKGLTNYWGYEPIAYFAPHPDYGDPVEFKKMVNAMHAAGKEVIMDVVYNHMGEGDAHTQMLSLKGIDSAYYYVHNQDDKTQYRNETGCGNALDMTKPMARKLAVDSLRYWAEEMGVDGFRFDLATVMGRGKEGEPVNRDFDKFHPFYQDLIKDPVLSKCKLIAEPWDCGWGGYQVGNFEKHWMQWNDRFRDDTRRFWCGNEGFAAKMAQRMTASDDMRNAGEELSPSVNFVTAHDGFTAKDLWSYNEKHNWANPWNNTDGAGQNNGTNWGHEGYKDEALDEFRNKMVRNLEATLLMASGVPMIVAGDEFNRSQGGNNNPYCQDNETSWVNWDKITDRDVKSAEMVGFMARLRRDHPVLANANYFTGETVDDKGTKDITWVRPDGQEMSGSDWGASYAKTLSYVLAGEKTKKNGEKADDDFMIIMNAHNGPVDFKMPQAPNGQKWEVAFDTAHLGVEKLPVEKREVKNGNYLAEAHSFVVLTAVREENRIKDYSKSKDSVLAQMVKKHYSR
ncbi:MAG: glycogen debranching protein GlgX [Alphaproteobacteria bacterium]|nr:glycogen debranching protein GlgX [Alphaproteobacteria bacterium]